MGKYLQSNRSVLSHVKRKIIGILPRKFHCFSLGAEKTGTTSLHTMFNEKYRSSHEREAEKTTQLVIDYLDRKITSREVVEILKKRDKLFNLEMESMHALIYLSEILVEIFPEAKFIVTIREPYSHLNSRLNWQLVNTQTTRWKNYIRYFWENNRDNFEPEEEFIQKLDLYPLDTFLRQNADHYKRVIKNIPPNRRIIIRTSELNNSRRKISSFLNIDESTLQVTHANKNKKKIRLLDQIDETFVRNKIWYYCSDMITEFFPETTENYELINRIR